MILPLLKEQFSKEVAERIIDVVKLDIRAPQREVLEKTIAALRQKDSETDREKVETLIGAYRANGLGVVGYEDTRAALELGQVEELIVTASADAIDAGEKRAGDVLPDRTVEERAADELIARARQTAARIRFIEDRSLLERGRRCRRAPAVQSVKTITAEIAESAESMFSICDADCVQSAVRREVRPHPRNNGRFLNTEYASASTVATTQTAAPIM